MKLSHSNSSSSSNNSNKSATKKFPYSIWRNEYNTHTYINKERRGVRCDSLLICVFRVCVITLAHWLLFERSENKHTLSVLEMAKDASSRDDSSLYFMKIYNSHIWIPLGFQVCPNFSIIIGWWPIKRTECVKYFPSTVTST